MAEEREDEKPRIQVVDRRMLSDDERAGKTSDASGDASGDASSPRPKLEIVGNYQTQAQAQQNPNEMPDAPDDEPVESDPYSEPLSDPQNPAPMGDPNDGEELQLSPEDLAQMEAEIAAAEVEQFAVIEERMGRPLTEQEREAVREEMGRQAQASMSLEVEPMLQQFLVQMSQVAAVHLGLMPNPYTRLLARNDAQSRLAIDIFGANVELLKSHLDEPTAREYERVLNDLRVNFVRITGQQIGTGSPIATGSLIANPFAPKGNSPRIIH